MVEEKNSPHELDLRQMLPWTKLFRAFKVAIDPRKLLLAAAGIFVMSIGWQAITWVFNPAESAWTAFGTWPSSEYRGPNPFLLVTNQEPVPADPAGFAEFSKTEGKVLLEPLVKLLQPVIYLFQFGTELKNGIYYLLILLWTLATWALFGGALTRMAAVEVARREKISIREAVRFSVNRYLSYFSAPLFPMIFVAIVAVLVMLFFGLPLLAPVLGEVWLGLFFLFVVLAGLITAVALIGLVGWPMMSATISAEGTDSWEAVSRSYSYVFQAPWHYLWYGFLAVVYGAVVVFFVGLVGSMSIYFAKWGLNQTPFVAKADREPYFLFVYAPESFGWRKLLLEGGSVSTGDSKLDLVKDGEINKEALAKYKATFKSYNLIGTWLVTVWLHLVFLLVVGFGYSYFWSAGTIIYLLMRRKVDDAEMDEIYLEDEEQLDLPREASAPAPPSEPAPPSSLTMVDAPALRPGAAPTSPPPTFPEESPPPPGGDGNPPSN